MRGGRERAVRTRRWERLRRRQRGRRRTLRAPRAASLYTNTGDSHSKATRGSSSVNPAQGRILLTPLVCLVRLKKQSDEISVRYTRAAHARWGSSICPSPSSFTGVGSSFVNLLLGHICCVFKAKKGSILHMQHHTTLKLNAKVFCRRSLDLLNGALMRITRDIGSVTRT